MQDRERLNIVMDYMGEDHHTDTANAVEQMDSSVPLGDATPQESDAASARKKDATNIRDEKRMEQMMENVKNFIRAIDINTL